jgi:3-hydroxy-9,10-secoandrosta-1,3,5(10)-triene-9,17-dione monooxygenase reductase component
MSGQHRMPERGLQEIAPDYFRQVLACLPTGITVIAAHGPDAPLGMAANSVTSVSLNPPLILFCPAKSSSTWPGIRAAASFCVNVMAGHHEEMTRRFSAKGADRFAGVDYINRPTGPALSDAVAWIECRVQDEHDAGDHTVVIARVVAIEASAKAEVEPLVFFRGQYGSFRAAVKAGSEALAARDDKHGT